MFHVNHARLPAGVFAILLGVGLASCSRSAHPPAKTLVAVSNSYLASAATDVAGDEIAIVCLAPPGTCPGQFDIRPSQVDYLRRCRVIFRFDFQAWLDVQVRQVADDLRGPIPLSPHGGMAEPETYRLVCRDIAEALAAAGVTSREATARRLQTIESQLTNEAERARRQVARAGLVGWSTLSSEHQSAFCRWLGLHVSVTYATADGASLVRMDGLLRAAREARVKLIVGNQPEGRGMTDALANRLGARAVVLDNFPASPQAQGTFLDMLRANVSRLLEAAAPE